MKNLPAQPVNGLIDGLRLLQELATRKAPVSCSELAKEMGIETTRMNRLLKTLNYLGMAERTSDRRYLAGPGIHVIAAQALSKSRLLQIAAPALLSIDAPKCIKAVGVLWNDRISYLMHKEPEMDFMASLGRLNAYPASRSSLGIALLAQQEDEAVDELYKGCEIPGFQSLQKLKSELALTRERGYGRLETSPGITSIAFVVGDAPQGAVAISGPMGQAAENAISMRLNETAAEISNALRNAAQET